MTGALFAIMLAILPACPTEDSNGLCGWNAASQGNGLGRSFIVIGEAVYYAETGR